jgi:hypothetical protein
MYLAAMCLQGVGAKPRAKALANHRHNSAATQLLVTPAKVSRTSRRPFSAPASKCGWRRASPSPDLLPWPDQCAKSQCARCRQPDVQRYQHGKFGRQSPCRPISTDLPTAAEPQQQRMNTPGKARGGALGCQDMAYGTDCASPQLSRSDAHGLHVEQEGLRKERQTALGHAPLGHPLQGQHQDPDPTTTSKQANVTCLQPRTGAPVRGPPGQSSCTVLPCKQQKSGRVPNVVDDSVSSCAQHRHVVDSLERVLSDLSRDSWQQGEVAHGVENCSSFAASLDSLAELEAEIALQHQRLVAAGVPKPPTAAAELSPSMSTFCSTSATGSKDGGNSSPPDQTAACKISYKDEKEASLRGFCSHAEPGGPLGAPAPGCMTRGDAAGAPSEHMRFSYPPHALMETKSTCTTDTSTCKDTRSCGKGLWGKEGGSPSPVNRNSVEEHLSQLNLSVRCSLTNH